MKSYYAEISLGGTMMKKEILLEYVAYIFT